MANQQELKFMLSSLKTMQTRLVGVNARKKLANSEFEYLQEQFLTKRHEIEKWQDLKDSEGVTTKTAGIPYKIREGVAELKDLLEKLKNQLERLEKNKKENEAVIQNRRKIVLNCEHLYRDIEERTNTQIKKIVSNKHLTLTDLKSKLLKEIDRATARIDRQGLDSEQVLVKQEMEAIEEFKQGDKKMEPVLDEVIEGMVRVREGVKNINEKQEEINKKIEKGNRDASRMNKRIQKDSGNMKVIVQKYNTTKCCLAGFLLLLLIGLVVVIIKLVVPKK